MAREELISSAVTFLQDPSVASSPLEKRVAFLQSKNLTQEEIDIAIARAGDGTVQTTTATTAPRYVVPLIAPPTPPQLEQDKQSIDEQFTRAFALIDQLSTDTAALKTAEEARTERLDAALREVETVVSELKSSTRRRDDDTRRISDEVKNLKESIPKALEGAREGNENRLKELGTELRSLKTLLNNRLSTASPTTTPVSGRPVGTPEPTPAPTPVPATTADPVTQSSTAPPPSLPTTQTPSTTSTNNPLSQLGRSASIPAWQMAAANKSKNASQSSASGSGEGTQASS
ncbi:Peroxisomal membrane protein PER10 [Talaromyces islandicus]|uniref:Peroxisomal membrane protein PEX14 n=1 Tax=Talaromyces islandicus TaxID=28573 RepID=A0A0U1LT49_TALIS|nr:Peroxisomal membrane protein PER10 [Talaromyces islandicus]